MTYIYFHSTILTYFRKKYMYNDMRNLKILEDHLYI